MRQGAKLVFNRFTHFSPHTSILVGEHAELKFGKNFSRNNGCRFSATNRIKFGTDVLLGGDCVMRDSDGHTIYDFDNADQKVHKSKVFIKIGNHVWIANNCHILKGVTIADDIIIGYGNLVVRDVLKRNLIYTGLPVRLVNSGIVWEREENEVDNLRSRWLWSNCSGYGEAEWAI